MEPGIEHMTTDGTKEPFNSSRNFYRGALQLSSAAFDESNSLLLIEMRRFSGHLKMRKANIPIFHAHAGIGT